VPSREHRPGGGPRAGPGDHGNFCPSPPPRTCASSRRWPAGRTPGPRTRRCCNWGRLRRWSASSSAICSR
jgi:hypothetical protein